MRLDRRKTVLRDLQATKVEISLHICAFVIHLLESIISRLAKSEISEAAATEILLGASLILLKHQKTGFFVSRPIYVCIVLGLLISVIYVSFIQFLTPKCENFYILLSSSTKCTFLGCFMYF